MGRLVVIEGLDGAGKRTLTRRLADALAAGAPARRPRLPPLRRRRARRARRATPCYGRLGDLADSVHGDGACCSRWTAARPPTTCARRWRSTTSCSSTATSPPTPPTAPPGCTRTPAGSSSPGCTALEIERFGLPVPDRHLLLDVPRAVAAQRAAHRERTDAGRARDPTSPTPGCRTARRRCTASSPRRVAGAVDGARRRRRTSSTAGDSRLAQRSPTTCIAVAPVRRPFHELSVGGGILRA